MHNNKIDIFTAVRTSAVNNLIVTRNDCTASEINVPPNNNNNNNVITCSRVLQKLVKKFSTFYGTYSFVS
jgi:hypothetical protein